MNRRKQYREHYIFDSTTAWREFLEGMVTHITIHIKKDMGITVYRHGRIEYHLTEPRVPYAYVVAAVQGDPIEIWWSRDNHVVVSIGLPNKAYRDVVESGGIRSFMRWAERLTGAIMDSLTLPGVLGRTCPGCGVFVHLGSDGKLVLHSYPGLSQRCPGTGVDPKEIEG